MGGLFRCFTRCVRCGNFARMTLRLPPRLLPGAFALLGACAGAPQSARSAPAAPCCGEQAVEVAGRFRVAAIDDRRFTQDELWAALAPALRSPALRTTQVGRSVQGRPLRAVTFGTGPVTVLLWSQMHGDESTATMSLADLIAWFGDTKPDATRDAIASALRVVMVPMLNPDGAELFQRQNAIGVDVNRDARRLVTPEARALKALRDSIQPAFGFNLHDQNARTLAGRGGQQVAIALLAPAADRERSWGAGRTRARHVAAVIAESLQPYLRGRVAKYDDTFEPRAFGDLMQQWGTSTVLIESGAMPDDPRKQRLRTMNVVAIMSALHAIAAGWYDETAFAAYDDLPMNARSALDVVVRGGTIVLPGADPIRADVALNYDDPVAQRGSRLRDVGDLETVVALDTVVADGLYLHPSSEALTVHGAARWLRIDSPVVFTLRRSADPASEVVGTVGARDP